ncbi:MAG: hypothetical protein WA867_18345 [Candidatus Acidiferrales bacterium]
MVLAAGATTVGMALVGVLFTFRAVGAFVIWTLGVPVMLTAPETAELTLPVTGTGFADVFTTVTAGPPAAAAGWLGRDDRTKATTPRPDVKSINLPKYFMVPPPHSSSICERWRLSIYTIGNGEEKTTMAKRIFLPTNALKR